MSPERAVQEVMAHYVRAVDARDGDGLVALFTADGTERVSYRHDGVLELLAEFQGHNAIRGALSTLLPAHRPGGWAHHTTFDHLVSVRDGRALLQAQFLLYVIPGAGSPPQLELSGYYEWTLVESPDGWLIQDNSTVLTVRPPSIAGAGDSPIS